jgi:hypothetical protein
MVELYLHPSGCFKEVCSKTCNSLEDVTCNGTALVHVKKKKKKKKKIKAVPVTGCGGL